MSPHTPPPAPPMLATLLFDLALGFWRIVLRIFFRSIRPRGAWHIPPANSGTAVLFAGAPHHNQFLDPLVLGSEAFRASGRRVSFLTAEKSLRRKFIGPAARMMGSISVVRAADCATPGIGRISWPPDSDDGPKLRIQGYRTQFTKQLTPRSQLVLPKPYGSAAAEVAQVLSDTECILKSPFKDVPEKLPVSQALAYSFGERPASASKPESQPLLAQPTSAPQGTEFIVFPHIDQSRMYAQVFNKLNEGGSLGIFPEGGSHDRTDLLPLKRGVVIMALGAMEANPKLKVQIVPVGLSYFHPHKFRSRAVVEFGHPIDVPSDLVHLFAQGGQKKREAVEVMMDIVFDGLKSVTVRAPDYETLQLVQAGRRLYVPPGMVYGGSRETMLDWENEQRDGTKTPLPPSTRVHLTLGQVVDLNRRFILAYLRFKDDPRVQRLKASVLAYNRRLTDLGLRDHQVEVAQQANWRIAGLLLYRVILLFVWGSLALPGFILNLPIFIVAKVISHKKAKEALAASQVKIRGLDVLATWKILVSLGMAPILYGLYASVLAYYLYTHHVLPQAHAWWLTPLSALAAMPLLTYSTIKFGEAGMDIYKSLPPLVLSLLPGHASQIEALQSTRRHLAAELQQLIDDLAPKIWPDYTVYKRTMLERASRLHPPPTTATATATATGTSPTVPVPEDKDSGFTLEGKEEGKAQEKKDTLQPTKQLPGAWIDDEELFGWRPSHRPRSHGIHSPTLSPVPAQSPSPHPFSALAAEHSSSPGVPPVALPPSAAGATHTADADEGEEEPQDDAEYAAAMDLAAAEVDSYVSTLTLAARAKAQTNEQTPRILKRPALAKARENLSQSLSRFFPSPSASPSPSSKETKRDHPPAQPETNAAPSSVATATATETAADPAGLARRASGLPRHRTRTRSHTLEEDISAADLRARYSSDEPPGPAPAQAQDHSPAPAAQPPGEAADANTGTNLATVPFDQAAHVLEGHPARTSREEQEAHPAAPASTQGGPALALPPLRAIPKLADIPQASRTPSRPTSPALLP